MIFQNMQYQHLQIFKFNIISFKLIQLYEIAALM